MLEAECPFCNPPYRYKDSYIADFEHWRLVLHENQYFLGRCLIPLKRHVEDFFDISKAELDEVYSIINRLRAVARESFGADMCNYAMLGNIVNHAHVHFIPRYSKPQVFAGVTFEDANWGKNYAPYDTGFVIPQKAKLEIVSTIKEALII